MKNLKDKVAALTGAGSGIGRSLAVLLAKEGCRLALSDINEAGLAETAKMLGSTEVVTSVLDVADREKMQEWADATAREFGGVDLVINNAGVAVFDTIEDISYEDFEWAFNIVFWGVVYGTKSFLPHLRKRPEGHIVNISSINGILPFPYNGPYNCAKFAVKALNETLNQELHDSSIIVTSVHPGGVKTNVARNMRYVKSYTEDVCQNDLATMFDGICRTTANQAALKIIKGIKKNKRRLLIGADARLMDLGARLMPLPAVKLTRNFHERMLTGLKNNK